LSGSLNFYIAFTNVIKENKVIGMHLLQNLFKQVQFQSERAEITENSAIQGVSSVQYERETFSNPVQGVN